MDFLGLIPARAGSKGILRKNMADLAGKPLVQYTMEAARGSGLLTRTLITTDDDEVIDLGKRLGMEAPFKRPAGLASDSSSMADVAIHAVEWLKDNEGYTPDAIVLLQPTSPFRNARDIDGAIEAWTKGGKKRLAAVCEVSQHPCEMVRNSGGRLQYAVSVPDGAARRQDFPDYYFISGAIYIVSTASLLMEKTWLDDETLLYIMPQSRSIDIDMPVHLMMARAMLEAGVV